MKTAFNTKKVKRNLLALLCLAAISVPMGACSKSDSDKRELQPVEKEDTADTKDDKSEKEEKEDPSDENAEDSAVAVVDDQEEDKEKEETTKETKKPKGKAGLETIEETVLVDQDGVKITAKELVEETVWGKGIKLVVENNTDHKISVNVSSMVVNNYMVNGFLGSEVEPGKKANEILRLEFDGLSTEGVDEVQEVNVTFRISDSESYDELFTTDEITLKTSAYEEGDIVKLDEGFELFNQDGIRIVGRYVDDNDFWGTAVLTYIENNTNQNIRVTLDSLSCNGYMMNPLFYSEVNAGRMSLDSIKLMESDLNDNDIETVEDLEVKFRISNTETWQEIVTTDNIPFNVQ